MQTENSAASTANSALFPEETNGDAAGCPSPFASSTPLPRKCGRPRKINFSHEANGNVGMGANLSSSIHAANKTGYGYEDTEPTNDDAADDSGDDTVELSTEGTHNDAADESSHDAANESSHDAAEESSHDAAEECHDDATERFLERADDNADSSHPPVPSLRKRGRPRKYPPMKVESATPPVQRKRGRPRKPLPMKVESATPPVQRKRGRPFKNRHEGDGIRATPETVSSSNSEDVPFELPRIGHEGARPGALSGLRICLSGTFVTPDSKLCSGGTGGRDAIRLMIEEFGGRVTANVSHLTDILLKGTYGRDGKNMVGAPEHIRTMTLPELKMIILGDECDSEKCRSTDNKNECNKIYRSWTENYNRLVDYANHHGDTKVPYLYPPDLKLGRWCFTQRQTRKKMSEERRRTLDDIGFWWGRISDKAEKEEQKYCDSTTDSDSGSDVDNITTNRNMKRKRKRVRNKTRSRTIGTISSEMPRFADAGDVPTSVDDFVKAGFLPPPSPSKHPRDQEIENMEQQNDNGEANTVFSSLSAANGDSQLKIKCENGKQNSNLMESTTAAENITTTGTATTLTAGTSTKTETETLPPHIWTLLISINSTPDGPLWVRNYMSLFKFRRVQGHVNVPVTQTGYGRWVGEQRLLLQSGCIREDRKTCLDAIGLLAEVDTRSDKNTDMKMAAKSLSPETVMASPNTTTYADNGAITMKKAAITMKMAAKPPSPETVMAPPNITTYADNRAMVTTTAMLPPASFASQPVPIPSPLQTKHHFIPPPPGSKAGNFYWKTVDRLLKIIASPGGRVNTNWVEKYTDIRKYFCSKNGLSGAPLSLKNWLRRQEILHDAAVSGVKNSATKERLQCLNALGDWRSRVLSKEAVPSLTGPSDVSWQMISSSSPKSFSQSAARPLKTSLTLSYPGFFNSSILAPHLLPLFHSIIKSTSTDDGKKWVEYYLEFHLHLFKHGGITSYQILEQECSNSLFCWVKEQLYLVMGSVNPGNIQRLDRKSCLEALNFRWEMLMDDNEEKKENFSESEGCKGEIDNSSEKQALPNHHGIIVEVNSLGH